MLSIGLSRNIVQPQINVMQIFLQGHCAWRADSFMQEAMCMGGRAGN